MGEDDILKSRGSLLEEMGVRFLLILAILSSVWYAFWVEKRNTETFQVLYTWFTQEYLNMTLMSFSYLVTKYLKKLLLIWILGWFSVTIPLSCIILFGIVFSYGFTTTVLILLWGSKGMVLGMFSYGVQAILLLSIGFKIVGMSINLIPKRKINLRKRYIQLLIPLTVGVVVMALLDLGTVNMLKILIK